MFSFKYFIPSMILGYILLAPYGLGLWGVCKGFLFGIICMVLVPLFHALIKGFLGARSW